MFDSETTLRHVSFFDMFLVHRYTVLVMKSCNIECLYILIDYNDTFISVVNTSDCVASLYGVFTMRTTRFTTDLK